jgi:hypothetical protein
MEEPRRMFSSQIVADSVWFTPLHTIDRMNIPFDVTSKSSSTFPTTVDPGGEVCDALTYWNVRLDFDVTSNGMLILSIA